MFFDAQDSLLATPLILDLTILAEPRPRARPPLASRPSSPWHAGATTQRVSHRPPRPRRRPLRRLSVALVLAAAPLAQIFVRWGRHHAAALARTFDVLSLRFSPSHPPSSSPSLRPSPSPRLHPPTRLHPSLRPRPRPISPLDSQLCRAAGGGGMPSEN